MKTVICWSLLFAVGLLTSCREEKGGDVASDKKVAFFEPQEGERWTYQVTRQFDPSANITADQAEIGPEGARLVSDKVRIYKGLAPIKAGAQEMAHAFEVRVNGRATEMEFCQIREDGIYTRASQSAGKERMLVEPILLMPVDLVPGALWEMSLPDPNDPMGAPMIYRRFQYFGLDKVKVMGEVMDAHRVKIFGKNGALEQQRDIWFVERLGIVKERLAHYSKDKRLQLVEEILVKHELPGEVAGK